MTEHYCNPHTDHRKTWGHSRGRKSHDVAVHPSCPSLQHQCTVTSGLAALVRQDDCSDHSACPFPQRCLVPGLFLRYPSLAWREVHLHCEPRFSRSRSGRIGVGRSFAERHTWVVVRIGIVDKVAVGVVRGVASILGCGDDGHHCSMRCTHYSRRSSCSSIRGRSRDSGPDKTVSKGRSGTQV